MNRTALISLLIILILFIGILLFNSSRRQAGITITPTPQSSPTQSVTQEVSPTLGTSPTSGGFIVSPTRQVLPTVSKAQVSPTAPAY